MHNSAIGVGIIGGSINNGWAKGTHVPAIRELPGLTLAAVATSRIESAEASAREFGAAHAFADAGELARHPGVDLVVASVKVTEHDEAVKAAIGAGKHVYCEWPLASDTARAEELLRLAAESPRLHAVVGLQARQAPEINYAKDLVADGYVGRVLSVNLRVNAEIMGGFAFASSRYTLDKSAGGNLFAIYGGHTLDALTYMLGDFTELSATVANRYPQAEMIGGNGELADKSSDDQILLHGKLAGGAMASIHIQGGVRHEIGLALDIFGDRGTLALRNAKGSIQMGPYQLLGARRNGLDPSSPLEPLAVPAAYLRVPESLIRQGGPVVNVAGALGRLAEDIREGTSRLPTFADAVKVHRLLDAVARAAETGERQFV
ncbi:Gfo/Idh/MocA family protein [Paenibacillus artemisiicola]|nr:Gfo/Idh/MocA family oxidoreductase [Paenibacillus artemisiicola]